MLASSWFGRTAVREILAEDKSASAFTLALVVLLVKALTTAGSLAGRGIMSAAARDGSPATRRHEEVG